MNVTTNDHQLPQRRPWFPKCRKTGKVRYPTEADAWNEIARFRDPSQVRENTRMYHLPCTVHDCAHCGGWHTSTKAGKVWKHGKDANRKRQQGGRRRRHRGKRRC